MLIIMLCYTTTSYSYYAVSTTKGAFCHDVTAMLNAT